MWEFAICQPRQGRPSPVEPSGDKCGGTQGPDSNLGGCSVAKEDQVRLCSDSGLGLKMGERRVEVGNEH